MVMRFFNKNELLDYCSPNLRAMDLGNNIIIKNCEENIIEVFEYSNPISEETKALYLYKYKFKVIFINGILYIEPIEIRDTNGNKLKFEFTCDFDCIHIVFYRNTDYLVTFNKSDILDRCINGTMFISDTSHDNLDCTIERLGYNNFKISFPYEIYRTDSNYYMCTINIHFSIVIKPCKYDIFFNSATAIYRNACGNITESKKITVNGLNEDNDDNLIKLELNLEDI